MRSISRLALVACLALTLKGSFIAQPSVSGVIALIGSGVAATSADNNNITTGTYTTTGAKLIVLGVATSTSAGAVSDSLSNTWTPLTVYASVTGVNVQILYCVNPIVGAAQTFTVTSSGLRPAIAALAFSGASIFDPGKDSGLGAVGAGTSAQPGSLTPSGANFLLVTGLAFNAAISAVTIDSSFISPAQAFSARTATGDGIGLTYLIETTATAKNPTWAWTTSTATAVNQAVFQVLPGTSSGGIAPRSSMH